MEEDQGGMTLAVVYVRRQEELAVDLESIGRGKENLFRGDEFLSWIGGGDELLCYIDERALSIP